MGYKIIAGSPLKRDKGKRFIFPKVWRTKAAAKKHKDSINKMNPKVKARIIKTMSLRKTPGQRRIRVS